MGNKLNQQTDSMKNSEVSIAETAHNINNQVNIIMLNAPVIKSAWNDVVSMLREYSDELEDFTIAGMPFEHACSILPELIEGIEKSSSQIKNIITDFKKSFPLKSQIEEK
jgi:two-component system, NtrC family, sensor kinase